jgi:phosphopantetheine--protein transferase-like protein
MRAPTGRVRVGCDVQDVGRLAAALGRGGPGFAAELFTEVERAAAGDDVANLARLFAVKEATLKILGIGLAQGVSLLYFEVSDAVSEEFPASAPAVMRHAVALRGPFGSMAAAPVTAYSWRRADHVYARACMEMRAIRP